MLDAVSGRVRWTAEYRQSVEQFVAVIGPWLRANAAARWCEARVVFRFAHGGVVESALAQVPDLDQDRTRDILAAAHQLVASIPHLTTAQRLPHKALDAAVRDVLADLMRDDSGPVGCGSANCPRRRPSAAADRALRHFALLDALDRNERSRIFARATETAYAAASDTGGVRWRRAIARQQVLHDASRVPPARLLSVVAALGLEPGAGLDTWGVWYHPSCTRQVRDRLCSMASPWRSEFVRLAETHDPAPR